MRINESPHEALVLVKSVEKAMLILNKLADAPRGKALQEVAMELGMPKSTVYGLLATMLQYNFVTQNAIDGRYCVGLRIFELGHIMARSLDINLIAEPYMNDLMKRFDTTVHLGHLNQDEVLYLSKMDSTGSPRINVFCGERIPAHATGVGKAMLAYLPPKRIERIIQNGLVEFTPHTITNGNRLKQELQKIAQQGYAEDRAESFENIHCIAAPIFDHSGKVMYSISVTSNINSMTPERRQDIINNVTYASSMISYYIGYQKNKKK